MRKEKMLFALMGLFTLTTFSTLNVYATGDVITDGGDTVTTTNGPDVGGDELTLDGQTDGTGTIDNTTNIGGDNLNLDGGTTPDTNTNLDLGNGDNTTENTTTQPTYEKVKGKENVMKFEFLIPDANKSYAVEFATGDKDLSLMTVVVNNNNISDKLKNSLSFVIKNDKGTQTIKLADLDVKPVEIKKGDKLYLVYNPDNVDNSNELSLSDNKLNLYVEQIRIPKQEGELSYDNGQLVLSNPVEYKEANVNYDVKPELVKNKTNTKKALTKKDTGPVENTIMLLLAIMLILSGLALRKKA